jgi:hypothetical protein
MLSFEFVTSIKAVTSKWSSGLTSDSWAILAWPLKGVIISVFCEGGSQCLAIDNKSFPHYAQEIFDFFLSIIVYCFFTPLTWQSRFCPRVTWTWSWIRGSEYDCSWERPSESARGERRFRHVAVHRSTPRRVGFDGRRRHREVAVDAGWRQSSRRNRRWRLCVRTNPPGRLPLRIEVLLSYVYKHARLHSLSLFNKLRFTVEAPNFSPCGRFPLHFSNELLTSERVLQKSKQNNSLRNRLDLQK